MTQSMTIPDTTPDLSAIERVIVAGDLSKLSQDQRWDYYAGVCRSLGLNAFTTPFQYLSLNGKLVLYATKGATDQLRGMHHISISKPSIDLSDGLCIVSVTASDPSGRQDSDLGITTVEGLKGDAKANAIMKAVTKSKRRVTLSMLGLGMLDESEIDSIPNAQPVPFEITEHRSDDADRLITYHGVEEIPFDEDEPETPALDPHRVVAYNQLIRRALMANNAANAAGTPEPFDLAEWELSSGTTLEDLNSQGRRLKAKLQELEAVSV
jgi:hypothetical protein